MTPREYLEQKLGHSDNCERAIAAAWVARGEHIGCIATCPRTAVLARWDAMERVIAAYEGRRKINGPDSPQWARAVEELYAARRALAELEGRG